MVLASFSQVLRINGHEEDEIKKPRVDARVEYSTCIVYWGCSNTVLLFRLFNFDIFGLAIHPHLDRYDTSYEQI
jgi:hypothetical protein